MIIGISAIEVAVELTATECHDSHIIARPCVPVLETGAFTINGLAFESDGDGGVTLPACP